MTSSIADTIQRYERVLESTEGLTDTEAVELLEAAIAARRVPIASPVIEYATATPPAPTRAPKAESVQIPAQDHSVDGEGRRPCPLCEFRGTDRQLGHHVRKSHWDDVIEEYAENGCKGPMDAFGISQPTAYNWRDRIGGEA